MCKLYFSILCFEFGRFEKFVDLRKKRFGLTMVAGVLGIFVFFFAKFRRFMFIVAFGFLEKEKKMTSWSWSLSMWFVN